jgi:ABC-type nitrate/sulfonate/bicarbonate transport system substrate-binding protein
MTPSVRQSVFVVPALCAIARALGFYEAEGVEVQDVMTTSSGAQRADLVAGTIDVAITSTDNLLAWNPSGSHIVQIAQVETTTDLTLMLRPGLATLDDVRRPRLAVDAATNGFAIVAYAMLDRLGHSSDSYQAVEIGGVRARYDALLAGDADLTLVAPPLDDAGVQRGMQLLMRISDLEPDYPGLGIVARRDHVDGHSEAIARYLAALERARQWISEMPPEAVATLLLGSGHGPRAAESVVRNNPPTLRAVVGGLAVLADLRTRMSLPIANGPALKDLVLGDHSVLAQLPPA